MISCLKSISVLCFSFIAMACAHQESLQESPQQTSQVAAVVQTPIYDASSWKSMIADSCQHFTDGCNTCTRMPGADVAACTRRACAQYKKPQCLDTNKAVYICSGQKIFTVFYKQYLSGDQKIDLKEGLVMLMDSQTHTVTALEREPSASGSKYSGAGLTFWEKGNEATLLLRGKPLYDGCSKR